MGKKKYSSWKIATKKIGKSQLILIQFGTKLGRRQWRYKTTEDKELKSGKVWTDLGWKMNTVDDLVGLMEWKINNGEEGKNGITG